MFRRIVFLCLLAVTFGLTACKSSSPDYTKVQGVQNQLPGKPVEGSPQLLSDEQAYQQGLSIRDTDRAKEAGDHAELTKLSDYERLFSQVVGHEVSETSTPKIHKLLKRVFTVSKEMIHTAKQQNPRQRPFAVHPEDKTCRPDLIARSNPNKSYPSGHAGEAWAVGLVLSKVFPDKAEAILELAHQAGDSRWICGYHWMSDVEAARILVERTVSKLMEDESFQKRLAKAKEEAAGL